jgi:hypothetical protein
MGQSQPPSPTPRKPADSDQKRTNGNGNVRRDDNGNAESISTAINKLAAEVKSWKDQQGTAQKKDDTPAEWWTKWSTIATAAATLAIAILGGFQWWAMDKQRAAMELQADYMRDALVETKKAADAAKASAESLMSSERAWIKIIDILDPKDDIPNGFWFNISNQGKTPARITALISKCESRPFEETLPGNPDYADAKRHIFGGDFGHEPLLVPAEKLTSTIRLAFPEETTWADIYTEAVRIYAYGFVTYIDSFEREHTLRFGYMYLPFRPEQRRSQWAVIPLRDYNQQS